MNKAEGGCGRQIIAKPSIFDGDSDQRMSGPRQEMKFPIFRTSPCRRGLTSGVKKNKAVFYICTTCVAGERLCHSKVGNQNWDIFFKMRLP